MSRRGFALISTVVVLALLIIIVTGLLSLSSVTVRSGSLERAQAEARANARMALIVALGELQKHLGPDQRISASAGILDDVPETPSFEGVRHPRWTGVWDSWAAGAETFGSDQPSAHRTISNSQGAGLAASYEEHRADHFRRWLVSLSKDQADKIDSAKDLPVDGVSLPGAESDAVRLVGKGSLGTDAPDSDLVSARLVGATSAGGQGRFAWWVADESTKARILADAYDPDDDLTKDERIARVQSAGSTGHDVIAALKELSDQSDLRRIHTRKSLERAADGGRGVRAAFHDVTPFSYGVLSDVREGGLKRDLNGLLERPILPNELDAQFTLYRVGREDRVPIQDLAAYYQLYREQLDFNGGEARNRLGKDVMQINNPDFTPGSSFKRQYTNLYRMPVPVKIQFLLSYLGKPRVRDRNDRNPDKYKVFIGITPAVTFWNPYNVPLVLNHGADRSTQIRFFNLPIALRWKKEGRASYRSQRPTSLSWITNRDRYGAGVFRGGGGDRHTGFELFVAGNNPIVFAPGEVRVFSLRQSSQQSGAAMIENTNQYRQIREVQAGWDPTKFIEMPRSDRNGDSRHVEQEGISNNRDDGIGGALTFNPEDQISFTVSAAENVDLANGAALQFFFRQSSVVKQGEGGPDDNKWMRRHYQMISRMHDKGPGGRESQDAKDFHRELMRKGFPDQKEEIEFPPISGNELIGQTRPFLLVSLTAGCEVYHENASDADARRFPSRPFLHSSPIHACPFVDRNDYDSFYHHAWNWWVQDVNSVFEASVQVDTNNRNSFYGGGYSADFGTTHLVQQEVPLTPLHSIAALSHARLGGYSIADNALGPGAGETRVSYQATTATGANGLFPHVLQAIGNSYAHPYLKANDAVGKWTRHYSQAGGAKSIPMVDHSYLANKALWDDCFFSSIAPHLTDLYETDRRFSARQVATRAFFEDEPLPNRRIKPYGRNLTRSQLLGFFGREGTTLEGIDRLASYLMVEGAFNVNSTSVDAWRAVFSSLRGKSVATLKVEGALRPRLPITTSEPEGVPVAGVSLPNGEPTTGSSAEPSDPAQWRSWRELTDEEIDELAAAMVEQVKIRGPFLSLSEFVNRRLDDADKELSLKGALQAALDDEDVSINEGFRSEVRSFSATEIGLMNPEFPEALAGPVAYGSAPYIDQADILRNLGAQLTPRGDTFVIRTYGDSQDAAGKVWARAWCEAVVQRVPEYLQATKNGDEAHLKQSALRSETNKAFGRPFRVISFRWLSAEEV